VSKGSVVSNLFSTTDKEWHSRLRRSVSNAFALSTLVQYEPLVNRTTRAFLDAIDTRFAGKWGDEGVVDLSIWLRYFAIEVIGEVAYSSPHGLLEAAGDPLGIMPAMHKFLRYFSVVSSVLQRDEASMLKYGKGL
jgi:cytochrome P450